MGNPNDVARREHARAQSRIASRRDQFARQAQQEITVVSYEQGDGKLDDNIRTYEKVTYSDGATEYIAYDRNVLGDNHSKYKLLNGNLTDDEYENILFNTHGGPDTGPLTTMDEGTFAEVASVFGENPEMISAEDFESEDLADLKKKNPRGDL